MPTQPKKWNYNGKYTKRTDFDTNGWKTTRLPEVVAEGANFETETLRLQPHTALRGFLEDAN